MLDRLRRKLYQSARFLGDVQAVRRGPRAMAKRAGRKTAWRWLFRWLR